jgi:hypothetical protein
MVAMITDTMTALRELEPAERRVLSDFCLLQSTVASHHRDERRMLRAVSEACEAIGPHRALEPVSELYQLQRRLISLPWSRRRALRNRTEAWLREGSREDLLAVASLLHA